MTRKIAPYLKLLRVRDTLAYFMIALFGFMLAGGYLASAKSIILFLIVVFFLLGFGFSINDCFDQKEDRFDKTKKNQIVLGKITFPKALIFSFSLAALGLAFSSLFGLKVLLFCLLAVLLPLFYSAPPLRLKSRVFLDIITHGLFTPFIFGLPLLAFETEITYFHYLIAFSLFYLSVILDLRNQWEEYESDKKAGLKNTFNVLGYGFSEKLLVSLAFLFPLILLPIFYSSSERLLLVFLPLSAFFLITFFLFRNYKLVKNYRLFDAYAVLSYSLLLFVF